MATRGTDVSGGRHRRARSSSWRSHAGLVAVAAGLVLGAVSVVGGAIPAVASGGSAGWAQVSSGGHHSCALTSTGTAYCWGGNLSGQLGNNDSGTDRAVPVAVTVPSGVSGWDSISAGEYHTCAIATSGAAYCWGANDYGELGNNDAGTDRAVPVAVTVPSGVSGWDHISAGEVHTCAIATSGAAYCWGNNASAQLGNNDPGTNQGVPVAVTVPTGVTGWDHISAGGLSCAIATSGAAYCWGANGSGQLGNNDPGTNQGVPVAVTVPSGVTGWDDISAGGQHACALTSSGAVYCWGYNFLGQLGNNDMGTSQGVPVAVTVPSGVTGWDHISASTYHTCAIAKSGAAYCWGDNFDGQLGNNDMGTNQGVPVAVTVPSGVSGWDNISGGDLHTCAIAQSGAAHCWGFNDYGQLANNDPGTDQDEPVGVLPVTQSITFTAPSPTPLSGGPVDVAGDVSASSGLVVTVASTSPSVCTVSGLSVTLVSAGTCALTATQPGDGAYAAATPVVQHFTVAKDKSDQTITLDVPSSMVAGATTSVSASATSGLPVDLSASGGCTLSGSNLTATAAGSCSVTATQAGDDDWNPALPVTRTVTITAATTTTSAPISTAPVPAPSAPAPATPSSTSTLPETGAPIGPATGGALALIGIGAALIATDRLRTRRTN